MKVTTSFLHLEHTPVLDLKIKEKSNRLSKYFKDKGTMNWSCFVKEGQHYAEVHYHASHFEYHAHAHSDDMYHTIDMAIGKIETQVQKDKDKFNKLHQKPVDIIWAEENDYSDLMR